MTECLFSGYSTSAFGCERRARQSQRQTPRRRAAPALGERPRLSTGPDSVPDLKLGGDDHRQIEWSGGDPYSRPCVATDLRSEYLSMRSETGFITGAVCG